MVMKPIYNTGYKKAGWKVYYLPDANTIHFGGRSMDRWRRRKMVYRGKMLFYKKNYGLLRTGILRMMLFDVKFGKDACLGSGFYFSDTGVNEHNANWIPTWKSLNCVGI